MTPRPPRSSRHAAPLPSPPTVRRRNGCCPTMVRCRESSGRLRFARRGNRVMSSSVVRRMIGGHHRAVADSWSVSHPRSVWLPSAPCTRLTTREPSAVSRSWSTADRERRRPRLVLSDVLCPGRRAGSAADRSGTCSATGGQREWTSRGFSRGSRAQVDRSFCSR